MISAPTHERVELVTGSRSGLLMIAARHSTRLGPALGGCRLWVYEQWTDALSDALRLSEGMTAKNALAGLPFGGGKAVIRLAPGESISDERRAAAFQDLGDLVQSFDGSYVTAEDVGTTASDMAMIATRTRHVVGLPESEGGLGDPGEYTARGVLRAIETTTARLGFSSWSGMRFTVVGLGQVGGRIARILAGHGARLSLSDVNEGQRKLAAELGATWVSPEMAHRVPADIFVPAGVGGMLTDQIIGELDALAVVGPANNQLATEHGAQLMAKRGILYAPDYLVNAGGVIYLGTADADRQDTRQAALNRIDGIGDTLEAIYSMAERRDVTPTAAADQLVQDRLR
jgi:leucine dehydrogenase